MTDATDPRAALRAFGETYKYDASYIVQLLDASPGAYEAFAVAQGMSQYRKELPLDAHFVARISTMLADDCGACRNLNIRMALEAGVARAVLQALISDASALPAELRDVHDHTLGVVRNGPPNKERADRLRARYGAEAFAEIAVVITGSRIYPTLKRALLADVSCEVLSLPAEG